MANRGINKVILVGNLGQDPDLRYTASNNAICNITIATSESWKDKNTGATQEKTEWTRVVMFRKLAEIAGEYLKKGSKVYIEGKLQTRKWQDKQGMDRYTTEVIADQMQMLDSRNTEPCQRPQSVQETPAASANAFDDDIPFNRLAYRREYVF